MDWDADRPRLYPDLVEWGGLAAAMTARARELGLPLPGVVPGGPVPVEKSASVESPVGYFAVMLDVVEREFTLRIWERGVELAGGSTADFDDVVRAACAWGSGLGLRQIRERSPVVRFGELAEAHERGDAVAVKWRMLREGPDAPVAALAAAAGSVPEVHGLFPYLSHGVLCLSGTTGYPYTTGAPCVRPPVGRSGYQVVGDDGSTVILETDSPAEAVRGLADALPPGYGPARRGTAADGR